MKTLFLNIILITLFTTTNVVKAQNGSKQFEKVQKEIISLINSSNPTFSLDNVPTPMTPEAIADLGFEQVYKNVSKKITMRDGKKLFTNIYKNDSKVTIVLLHGILSSAYLMNKTAGLLRKATNSEVIAIDLRGHGQSEGKPGDVDYINQYVDDLEDVILYIKKEKPNQKIIIAGHSMGGGISLRYAMKENNLKVDGYLLFAPHLGANSPTINATNSKEEKAFIKLHMDRIIGLKMLNAIGDTSHNYLPVLFFNLPKSMPVTKYSYRANESMSPLDYKKGLNAINKPLLVVVGSKDDAFNATKFTSVITENTNGKVVMIEGETHNGIRHNKKTMEAISLWIKTHKLQ